MKDSRTQIEIRQEQIETALAGLKSRKNIKRRDDFRSDRLFENWQQKREKKLAELEEEMRFLENPSDYNEVPLAIAATELGMTITEVSRLIDEDLMAASFVGEYKSGTRVTRDELARIIEAGPQSVLQDAEQSAEELFEVGLAALHAGDLERAEKARNRLDSHWSSWEFEMLLAIGLKFAKGEFEELLDDGLELKHYKGAELAAKLKSLRRVIDPLQPTDHLSAVIFERLIAVTEGKNVKPFSNFFERNELEPVERMDENQRHAAFVATVVIEALHKYKFVKAFENRRSYFSRDKEVELQRVIRDAIFTAFEAEQTYHDSPSSKLFVDRIVHLFPKSLIPAEPVEMLPRSQKSVITGEEETNPFPE